MTKRIPWVDLSAHDLKLSVVQLKSGSRFLVLSNGEGAQEAAEALGFTFNERLNLWIMRGNKFTPRNFVQRLQEAGFTETQLTMTNLRDVVLDLSQPAPAPAQTTTQTDTETPAETAAETPDETPAEAPEAAPQQEAREEESAPVQQREESQARERRQPITERGYGWRFLGKNRLGQEVYEAEAGRYLRDRRGHYIPDDEGRERDASLYLRARDKASLAHCADAFVMEISAGRNLRGTDFDAFLETIHGREIAHDDPLYQQSYLAVEGALARNLVRQQNSSSMQAFNAARRLHEGHAFRSANKVDKDRRASLLPLPIAIAATRLIGTERDIGDRRLHVVDPGVGSLVSSISAQTNLKVWQSDAEMAEETRLTLVANGHRVERVLETTSDVDWSADFAIANLAGQHEQILDRPLERDGIEVVRHDLATLIEALEQRPADGRSVFFLTTGEGEQAAEVEEALNWVASRYAIEGIADIDGALHHGAGGGSATRMLVVGSRRPEPLPEPPEAALRRKDIFDFGSLWSWTSEVASNRAKIADYHASVDATRDVGQEVDEEDRDENSYQIPYVPMSKLGASDGMVPRNLAGPIREALTRIAKKNGDIDEWVARQLALSHEELAASFSPDQVDAIALCMDANERNRGFMLADQTGRGKGRVLAALMRWGVLNDKKILFLTERAMNLSDIWRDLRSIGTEDIISPMILNANTEIIDAADNSVIFKSPKKSEIDEILEQEDWPEDYNLILATYSQFNRSDERSAKVRWIKNIVDENTFVIADEVHTCASRASKTSENATAIINQAGSSVYSSATFAKDAKTMSFYSKLFPDDMDADELMTIIREGGETMQEVVSTMLARDGVMIRREHDLTLCDYVSIHDDEYKERNFAYMDRLAPVLSEMAYLSGEVGRRVNAINRVANFFEQMEGEGQRQRRGLRRMELHRVGFGSVLYNISKLFLSSLKVDSTVKYAVECLRNNEKPIVLVENTLQSLLLDLKRSLGEDEEIIPDFRDLMHRALDQMTRTREQRGNQNEVDMAREEDAASLQWRRVLAERVLEALPTRLLQADQQPIVGDDRRVARVYRKRLADALEEHVADLRQGRLSATERRGLYLAMNDIAATIDGLPEDIVEGAPLLREMATAVPNTLDTAVRRIRAMIDDLPPLPISVIDEVKERIEAEGYSVGEITGRTIQYTDGKIQKRERPNSIHVKNDFNNGVYDALIINDSASTGIDLYAGPNVPDQRPRCMVLNQMLAQVTKHSQVLGRIVRLNQVNRARVATIQTGLPMEVRIDAMMNTKLRRLSANVTSNRENATLIRETPDMINSVGDQVCTYYAAARPDIVLRLGLENNLEEMENQNRVREGEAAEDSMDNKRSANTFLARLMMLPVALQEQVAQELFAEFEATIEELDAKGINPLRTKQLPGVIHEKDRYIFEGADVENPESAFHEPVYAIKADVETPSNPIRSGRLSGLMESGMAMLGAEDPAAYAERLERNKERILQPYLPPGMANVQAAMEAGVGHVIEASTKLDRLVGVLSELKIGSEITMSDFDESRISGIVTSIKMPPRGFESIAAKYDVEFAIPGDSDLWRVRLINLLKDPNFTVNDGLNGADYDEILDRFDHAPDGVKVEERTLLSGNLFRAMLLNVQNNRKLGGMYQITDNEGQQFRGLVVARKFSNIDFIPVRLSNAEMAFAGAQANITLRTSMEHKKGQIIVKPDPDVVGMYAVNLPGRRNREYRHIYENDYILNLVNERNCQEDGRKPPRLRVAGDELYGLLNNLANNGVHFYVSGNNRRWANAWLGARGQELEEVAETAVPENNVEEEDEIMEITAA